MPEAITDRECRKILVASRESQERLLGSFGQEQEVAWWAEDNGFQVVGRLREPDEAGDLPVEKRPELARGIVAIENGWADAVCWTEIDRLARDWAIQEQILAEYWSAGARVFLVHGGELLPDAPGDTARLEYRKTLAEHAERELRRIRQRRKMGRAKKLARGGYGGGSFGPPYEMDRVVVQGRVEHRVNRERWAIKERMVAMYEASGNFAHVARQLNADGLRMRDGQLWTRKSVRHTVLKPFPVLLQGVPELQAVPHAALRMGQRQRPAARRQTVL